MIGRPRPEWGEMVVAYVVGKASANELDALCLPHIARFKRPKDYVFVDALPKNNYGKILKTELRANATKADAIVNEMADKRAARSAASRRGRVQAVLLDALRRCRSQSLALRRLCRPGQRG